MSVSQCCDTVSALHSRHGMPVGLEQWEWECVYVCMYVCVRVCVHVCPTYLIILHPFMLRHSGYVGRHLGNVRHHLVHHVVEVSLLAEVQRGGEGHLLTAEHQLHLEEGCDGLGGGGVRVLQEVLQGATHAAGAARQHHAVHEVCVGSPLGAARLGHGQQRLVLLRGGTQVGVESPGD